MPKFKGRMDQRSGSALRPRKGELHWVHFLVVCGSIDSFCMSNFTYRTTANSMSLSRTAFHHFPVDSRLNLKLRIFRREARHYSQPIPAPPLFATGNFVEAPISVHGYEEEPNGGISWDNCRNPEYPTRALYGMSESYSLFTRTRLKKRSYLVEAGWL
ncbi:hypothetical protein L218DRAFT_126960 [Marasmius fiardii PR-910]|nr:hypothetical protein L218DRAFT_126960 [Marasmius fiardii PR-910]